MSQPEFLIPDRGMAHTPQIRACAELLIRPGDVVELRALGAPSSGTVSGYFNDLDAFVEAAAQWSGRAEGVYATLNPVWPDLLARANNRAKTWAKHTTADVDVQCRRWLPLDFDPVRPSGISSTDQEHSAAIERAYDAANWLESLGFPEAAMPIADSGNGAHVPVRIDLPNDDDAKALVKACLAAVAAKFTNAAVEVDLTTFNAARIWKVYGTASCKGDSMPERPHRLAVLLDCPDVVVPVGRSLLEKLAALAPPATMKPQPRARAVAAASSGEPAGAPPSIATRPNLLVAPPSFDLAAWLAEHNLTVAEVKPWQGGTLYVLEVCRWDDSHANRSAYVIQHANGAIAAGCHHNGCAGKDWHALRDLVEPGWRDRGNAVRLPEGVPAAIARQYQNAIANARRSR